jgi:hypothetical protein
MNPKNVIPGALIALLLLFGPAGCVCSALKDQAATMAAVSDGYTRNARETVTKLHKEGELGKTPLAVKLLLQALLNAEAKHRKNWHEANRAVNDAELPADLDEVINAFLVVTPAGAGQ